LSAPDRLPEHQEEHGADRRREQFTQKSGATHFGIGTLAGYQPDQVSMPMLTSSKVADIRLAHRLALLINGKILG
jgi:hypothetical protein